MVRLHLHWPRPRVTVAPPRNTQARSHGQAGATAMPRETRQGILHRHLHRASSTARIGGASELMVYGPSQAARRALHPSASASRTFTPPVATSIRPGPSANQRTPITVNG